MFNAKQTVIIIMRPKSKPLRGVYIFVWTDAYSYPNIHGSQYLAHKNHPVEELTTNDIEYENKKIHQYVYMNNLIFFSLFLSRTDYD